MSMHEFEALVEQSVRVLDKCDANKKLNTRSCFHTLYSFQGMFDTGMTYFRVMDILIKHKFFYEISAGDLPNYEDHKPHFEKLNGDNIESIYNNPDRDWHFTENPVVAYWRNHKVYVPSYSTIIEGLIKRGVLPATESTAPERLDLFEVASLIAEEAESQKHIELIAYWYLLIPNFVFMQEDSIEALPANKHLLSLKDIAKRSGADKLDLGYGMLVKPKLEDLENSEMADFADDFGSGMDFLKWWYQLN